MAHTPFEWEAQEYVYTEKSSDWFWAVGIITVAAVVTCVIFNNILFGIVILLGSIALTMHSTKEPPVHQYRLSERGLHIDDTYYTYTNLESYWIEEDFYPVKILFKSKKFFMPYIIVPLDDDLDFNSIRQQLARHLKTEEHHESIFHKIFEYLGF
jgi:hypothetical protein